MKGQLPKIKEKIPFLLKIVKTSIKRRINTTVQDKKLGKALKTKQKEILQSLLSESNGVVILHTVDTTAAAIDKLLEQQAKMIEKVSHPQIYQKHLLN